MPKAVRKVFGHALHLAQLGERGESTKILSGFGSAGVVEVIEDYATDTYRAVYTVRFKRAVFVLHCFKKKSTQGIRTPKRELDCIRARIKVAEQLGKEEERA